MLYGVIGRLRTTKACRALLLLWITHWDGEVQRRGERPARWVLLNACPMYERKEKEWRGERDGQGVNGGDFKWPNGNRSSAGTVFTTKNSYYSTHALCSLLYANCPLKHVQLCAKEIEWMRPPGHAVETCSLLFLSPSVSGNLTSYPWTLADA